MSTPAETLWAQLIATLRRAGRLPLGHERMTPAELAGRLAATGGDRRVARLVWDWYYPRRYGDQPGGMSDTEAEALIAALGRGVAGAAGETGQAPHSETAAAPACRICGGELPPLDPVAQ